MRQIFHHYKKWECFKNGMYRKVNQSDHILLISKAIELLSNQDVCYQGMKKVITQWHFSTLHNMTNISQNRRAWLGQAACCLEFAVPEELTKIAWNRLSKDVQDKANAMADLIIQEWENCYAENIS